MKYRVGFTLLLLLVLGVCYFAFEGGKDTQQQQPQQQDQQGIRIN